VHNSVVALVGRFVSAGVSFFSRYFPSSPLATIAAHIDALTGVSGFRPGKAEA
jgi:hypothetical protein